MNILFLCHRIPYPPNKGDKIRSFNEIKYLSKNHDIYLAFLVDDTDDLTHVNELKKFCKEIDYDVIYPRWQKIKSLPYLFTKKPLSVPYFYSKRLQKKIDKKLSEIDFDVIFAFSSPMAEYVYRSESLHFKRHNKDSVREMKRPRLIMDFVDVDSDKWRLYSEYSSFPKSLIYRNEWKRLMAYEKKIGEIFHSSVFVSEAEVKLFRTFVPQAKAVSIPNGVDFPFFSDIQGGVRPDGQRANIVFTGAMDYFPNVDGVLYFFKTIWPVIKKRLPHSKFFIVGANPPHILKMIPRKDQDVVVTGQVSDIREYLRLADVFVVPLRIARGVQNKILEAMAAGLPVVSTPQASQGITCSEPDLLYVENSDENFARRIIELAKNRIGEVDIERRRLFLMQTYNWEKNLAQLEKICNTGDANA